MSVTTVAALALGACAGSSDDTSAETPPPSEAEAEAETTPTAAPADEPSTTEESTPTSVAIPAPSPIVLTAPALYPEGLTFDPVGDRFIIGTLLGGELLAVDDDGSISTLAESPGSNLTGVEVDVERNRVLVAVTRVPWGVAQLSVHDLDSGEQLQLVDFASVLPEERRFANGIAVDVEGNIYVTDTGAGVIYAVDSAYTPSVFAENDAFEPDRSGITASGLNGLVYVGDALIVGHAPSGQLFRVPLSNPGEATAIPTGVDGMRIDGLHMSDDGGTLAVVSNLGSVHLFESADDWSTVSEVGRFDVGDSFPTSVTDRAGTFFVLQAHLDEAPDPAVDTFEIVPVLVD
ncbi:MAG: hypothetical protein RIB98_16990 [Acidimicrobiales bacterium]